MLSFVTDEGRFGKTVFSINEMIDRALRNDLRNPQYAYFAPTYGQAKRVAWDYLKDYCRVIPGATPNESELKIEIPRPARGDKIKIMLLGSENPDAIRGMYLDGCILDEYAQMDPTIWSQVIRPMLSDRTGWAIFIGTPKGQNHFYKILKLAQSNADWFWTILKASETEILSESELRDAKDSGMTQEEYDQEYECSFTAALIGAYYGKQMADAEAQGRICRVPYDPAVPVYTFWDLGIGDNNVIWFMQAVGPRYQFIDYIQAEGKGLDHYVKLLQDRKYVYGEHFFPHDMRAKELGTGKTREETFKSLWPGARYSIGDKQSIEDGINEVRKVLPKCYFDEERCALGLDGLKNYEKKWDAKEGVFLNKPRHNWASHPADGFRNFAMSFTADRDHRRSMLPRKAKTGTKIL